jgi:hypothetical protein
MNKRCLSCQGSGRMMGGGMMMKDCEICNGRGSTILPDSDEAQLEKLKKTSGYEEAIQKIKDTDKSITDEKAQEIFDAEFKKLDEKPKVARGRPKRKAS